MFKLPRRLLLPWSILVLIHLGFLLRICAAGNARPSPSEAPIVGEFNDPNAIHYDAAHEAELDRFHATWEISEFNDKYGYAATVNMGGVDRRVEKDIDYHVAFPSIGSKFLDTSLVRFLDRRASGDLREGIVKSKYLAGDVQTIMAICAEAGVKQATPAFLKLLDDPNPGIQHAGYRLIATIGYDDPAVFQKLAAALSEGRMIQEIARGMHRFGASGLPPLLSAMEKQPDAWALESLALFGANSRDAVPLLTRFLENRDETIRGAAAQTLGHIGPAAESSIAALIHMHDRGGAYAPFAYAGLANMSAKGREAMLADGRLKVENEIDAMRMLGSAQPYRDGVPILIAALRDPKAEVRHAAASSLHGEEAADAVPELIRRLEDTDADVQVAAANALGVIGRNAEPAIAALQAAAQRDPGGPHGPLYFAAYSAIKEIEWHLKITRHE